MIWNVALLTNSLYEQRRYGERERGTTTTTMIIAKIVLGKNHDRNFLSSYIQFGWNSYVTIKDPNRKKKKKKKLR